MGNDDWEARMDNDIQARGNKRRAEEEAAIAAEERKLEDKRREKERQQRAFEDKKLLELRRKYKCKVCGELPTGPGTSYTSQEVPATYYPDDDRTEWIEVPYTDWDLPGGLEKCTICGKWFCTKNHHIYHGVCVNDAKKGYLPGDKRKLFG